MVQYCSGGLGGGGNIFGSCGDGLVSGGAGLVVVVVVSVVVVSLVVVAVVVEK